MASLLPPGFGLGGHIETTLRGLPLSTTPLSVHPELATGSDNELMLRALVVSMQGVGETIPNPAVGCIVRNNGQRLSEGATEAYGGRHAERVAFEAIQKSGKSLSNSDVYVTLEPCSHHGRQPPCCELFSGSGVSRVIVALEDPNPLVHGRGLRFIESCGIPVELSQGSVSAAAAAWHLPFLVQQTSNRPLLVGKWAQTLDGTVADHKGSSKWITGSQARAHGHWLRMKYDVTAVGLGTFLADRPALTARDCWRPNDRQPHVCIIDPLGRSQPQSKDFQAALNHLLNSADNRRVALMCPQSHLLKLSQSLPKEVGLIALPSSPDSKLLGESLKDVWQQEDVRAWLGRMPQSVYIEGGAKLLSLMIEAEALDALHVFIAPMLLGGAAQRVGKGIHNSIELAMAAHFDILSTSVLGNDMLVELVSKRIRESFFARG